MEILNRASLHKLNRVRMVGKGSNEIVHIRDAFNQAEELGLDLVLVSDAVTPPVVRIQDFKKIEYEKKKARKANKQVSTMKEMPFKINISDHDLATKRNRVESFLKKGDKVKLFVRLKGREHENPERGYELLMRVSEGLACKANRLPGSMPMVILEPEKVKGREKKGAKKPQKPAAATTSLGDKLREAEKKS